ncbi:MAG: NAD(P)-dependent oxidoreductase [Candidatus Thorarchaeota archaeon]|jgi:phosphoglycerate dehydrogenase-like enzyme
MSNTIPTKVLFIWDVPLRLQDYLKEGLKDIQDLMLIFLKEATEDDYMQNATDVDIIVGWRPPMELLEAAKNLRLYVNPGAGIKHLIEPFLELNKTRDVTLVNGHGNSYLTAQHTVALLLALMNKVIPHHNWMSDGEWRKGDSDFASSPLRDRQVGLLGYGAVNRKVHQFLSSFRLDFSILKRSWDDEIDMPSDANKYIPIQLNDFLDAIDVLILAVPETSDTIGLIGKQELKRLGPEGLLVNVSRGIVIDEAALYSALQGNVIAGAALDVWYNYRPEADEDGRKRPYTQPFHTLVNVVLSPHRAASPFSDLERWNEVIENIRRFASGRTDFLNVVDLDKEY